MDTKRQTRISKYLSLHLRHEPERLGLTLQPGGWVEVEALLDGCARDNFPVTRAELEAVVAGSDKQRFAFDETAARIRANQGHSVEVDLQLTPQVPPDVLYHGTPDKFVAGILHQGLLKMSRHHVHLSPTIETARKVGQRRGRPVILVVDAAGYHRDGGVFYRSANGVWLVDELPSQYLRLLDPNETGANR